MINLYRYRKLSVSAVIILVITWLAALAAFWNSLLNTDAKNVGWVIFFMIIIFVSGLLLFYIAFTSADPLGVERIKKEAFEAGKSEVILEAERKKQTERDQQVQSDDIRKIIDAILSGIHGVRSESGLCNKLLASLAREMGFVQGIMYVKNKKDSIFNPSGEYALTERKPQPFKEGEALAGQAAMNKSMTVIYDIPEDYFVVSSGLGNSMPRFLVLAPVVYNDESIAVLELASFRKPDDSTGKILDKVLSEVGHKINKFITAS